MKLYEITSEIRGLLSQLDGTEEKTLADEEIAARLDLFEGQFEFKAEQIAKGILEMESQIVAINNEVGRLEDRQLSLSHSVQYLKEYLKSHMEVLSFRKIKGDTVTLSIRENPASLEIIDMKLIPDQWWRQPPTPEKVVDKAGILGNFRSTGEIVAGTKVVHNTRLEIK